MLFTISPVRVVCTARENQMKRLVVGLIAGVMVVSVAGVSSAADKKNEKAKKSAPVQLTAKQMDQVVAGRQAGSDTLYNSQTGLNYTVGDNTNANNKRSDPSPVIHIYDWNAN